MRTTDTTTTSARTSSPWGGATMAGIVSLIVNVIIAWVIWLIIPPAEASDLGYLLTMVGITSFFAGLFAYYGAFQQHNRL
jgi:uncharacterized RDD family membrane protein YckC